MAAARAAAHFLHRSAAARYKLLLTVDPLDSESEATSVDSHLVDSAADRGAASKVSRVFWLATFSILINVLVFMWLLADHLVPCSFVPDGCDLYSAGSALQTAYILSNNDERYSWSMATLQRGFPGLFDCHRVVPIRVQDPQVDLVDRGSIIRSQQMTIFGTWEVFARGAATRCLPDESWMVFFEDDVNVWSGLGDNFDFGTELLQLLNHPTVREDGMIYLGKCGGPFNLSQHFRHEAIPAPGLLSLGGYGVCNHALAFTKRRAASMAADIGVWQPQQPNQMDQLIKIFVQRAFGSSGHWPMVFGGAVEPRGNGTGQFGVVYQDWDRWPPKVIWDEW